MPSGRARVPLCPQTRVGAITRGMRVMAIFWQGGWMLGQPDLWPVSHGHTVNGLLMAAMIGWFGLILVTFGPRRIRESEWLFGYVAGFDITMIFAAGVALLLRYHAVPVTGWEAGASAMNLAVGLVGILVIVRWAVPIVAVAVISEVALLHFRSSWNYPAPDSASNLLYGLYALVIGGATIGSRRGLMIAARSSQEEDDILVATTAQASALAEVSHRLARQERLMHETVLNTLAGVALGGGSSIDVRTLCGESAGVIRSMSQAASEFDRQTVGWDIDGLVESLTFNGIEVDVHLDPVDQLGVVLPREVQAAFRDALHEALINVLRHACASHVRVKTSASVDGLGSVTIVIEDDGLGFDPVLVSGRYGIRHSIVASMVDVGGEAKIASTAGAGATVTLTWNPGNQARRDPLDLSRSSTDALILPVLASFGLMTFCAMLVTLDSSRSPVLVVTSFLLIVCLGGALVWFNRSGVLPKWLILGICCVIPFIYQIHLHGVMSEDNVWGEWGSEAILALALCMVAAGPWWSAPVCLLAWVITQGSWIELWQAGSMVIIATGFFARSVRRNVNAYRWFEEDRLVEQSRILTQQEVLMRESSRYLLLSSSGSEGLLQGICDGVFDPLDPEVREECGREELFVRAILHLDPARDRLHARAGDLSLRARAQGKAVIVDIAGLCPMPDEVIDRIYRDACWVVDQSVAEEHARLTSRWEGDTYVIRLVGHLLDPRRAQDFGTGPHDESQAVVGYQIYLNPDDTILLEARYG